MAMTKKEKAAFDAAIERAEILAALRWTAPVLPDVPPPKSGYSEGWEFNAYTRRVEQAWSDTVTHGSGPAPHDYKRYVSASQNGIALYSTKARALAALRYEVELQAAKMLLEIDKRIALELAPVADSGTVVEAVRD
jgi:hypothetical protein